MFGGRGERCLSLMYVDIVEYSEARRHISVVWRFTTDGARGRESSMATGGTDEYVTHPERAHKYQTLKYILWVIQTACNMETLWHSLSCYWKVTIWCVIKKKSRGNKSENIYFFQNSFRHFYRLGTTVAQWLKYCATNRKVAGSIPASVSGFFIDIKSFRSHYGPGVDSASNRNEYQEYFLGVKTAGA